MDYYILLSVLFFFATCFFFQASPSPVQFLLLLRATTFCPNRLKDYLPISGLLWQTGHSIPLASAITIPFLSALPQPQSEFPAFLGLAKLSLALRLLNILFLLPCCYFLNFPFLTRSSLPLRLLKRPAGQLLRILATEYRYLFTGLLPIFSARTRRDFFFIYHTNILALESNASIAKPYTKIFKNCRDNKYQTQKESNKAGVRTL